jgi:C1A family cysteine protease
MQPLRRNACLPDPPKKSTEAPDKLFLRAVFPPAAKGDHVIRECTPVSDQGGIGSCVANATCDALEIVMGLESSVFLTQLSRMHLYWLARAADGTTTKDDGTYIRSALRQANKVGVCAEDEWPYAPAMVFQPPPIRATVRASENKIAGYYRIDSTGRARLDDIAWAIRANHPVVFGTKVGKNWDAYAPGAEALLPPDPKDKTAGGHATILTGVIQQGGRYRFLDRNSWGDGWGEGGHAWLDEDYLTWGKTGDIWVLTRMGRVL